MAEEKKETRTTDQRIADLELQLAQSRAGTATGTIPEHGGGVGTDIAETWSQHDQTLAYNGEHPDQDDGGDEEKPDQRPPAGAGSRPPAKPQ